MSKYGNSGDVNIENELAEMNRLKRVELDMKIADVIGAWDKDTTKKFMSLIKVDGAR